ncbi:hypothetical protein LZ31DRAFT_205520 [Colletotrichum somersetense]|nr:hypothetical protein LZ31DRAFT_205520 [Colletotrichum somersetense]
MDGDTVLPLIDSIRTICANDNWMRNVETHTTVCTAPSRPFDLAYHKQLAHAVVELVCGFPTSIRAQIYEKLCGQAADPLHSTPVPSVRAAPLAVQSHRDILELEERLTKSPAEFFGSSSLNVAEYLCLEEEENELIRGIAFALIIRELFECRNTWHTRPGPFKESLRRANHRLRNLVNRNMEKWMRCGRTFAMVAKEFGKGALIALPPEENLSTSVACPSWRHR